MGKYVKRLIMQSLAEVGQIEEREKDITHSDDREWTCPKDWI